MVSSRLPKGVQSIIFRMVDLLNGLLFHIPICYKLGVKLLKSLSRGTWTWIIMLARLLIFTVLLIPGWIGMVKYWLFSPNILRNVEYGLGARKRNLLDVYLPPDYAAGGAPTPVVIFVTGGAWIIGYKLWCALIGRGLSSMGILTIVPDYRNFPQGDIEDMLSDIIAAVKWTAENVSKYNGDPEKLVLAGQSAGAHICMCAIMDALRAKILLSKHEGSQKGDTSENIINGSQSLDVIKEIKVIKDIKRKERDLSVWETMLSPPDSVRRNKALFETSPVRENTLSEKKKISMHILSEIKKEMEVKEVKKVIKMDGKEKGRDNVYNDDWEREDDEDEYEIEEYEENDTQDDEDDIDSTWKTTNKRPHLPHLNNPDNTPTKKIKKSNSMMLGSKTPKGKYGNSPKNSPKSPKLSPRKIKIGSPRKISEIPFFISTTISNVSIDITDISKDIKHDIEIVYKEVKEKVRTVVNDLESESTVLKNNENIILSSIPETLDLHQIKLFIGISGPYNLQSLSSHMQSRGLDHSILEWICRNNIMKYSPVLQLENIMLNVLEDIDRMKNDNTENTNNTENKTNYESTHGNPLISVNNDALHILTHEENLCPKFPELYTGTTTEDISPVKTTDFASEKYVSSPSRCLSPNIMSNITGVNNTTNNVTNNVTGVMGAMGVGVTGQNNLSGSNLKTPVQDPRKILSGWGYPPVALFHGAEDISVPSSVSVEMAAALCRWGGEVFLRMYEGWAHTDAILEGPLSGDMTLCEDILCQIRRVFPPPLTRPLSSSLFHSTPISLPFSATNSTSHSIPLSISLLNVTALPSLSIPPSFSSARSYNQNDISVSGENKIYGNGNNGNGNGSCAVCPRCSLRFNTNTNLKENKSAKEKEKIKHEIIKKIEKHKKVAKFEKVEKREYVEIKGNKAVTVAMKINGQIEINEGCVNEYSVPKSNVQYVTAHAVHTIPTIAKNIHEEHSQECSRVCSRECSAGYSQECSSATPLCHCEESFEETILSNTSGYGKNSKKDLLTDCHVNRYAVKMAKWVNPF